LFHKINKISGLHVSLHTVGGDRVPGTIGIIESFCSLSPMANQHANFLRQLIYIVYYTMNHIPMSFIGADAVVPDKMMWQASLLKAHKLM